MGSRKAIEMVLTDKLMRANEAHECGYINGIIDLQKGDFFDYE